MRSKLQLEGKIGRTDGVKQNSFFATKKTQSTEEERSIRITVKNTGLNVERGDFNGDIEEARKAIQSFADQNEMSYQSHGRGYGTLFINKTQYHTNPYGIDVPMMLEFCNIDVSSLNSSNEMK